MQGILIPVKYNPSQNPVDAMDPREADIKENMKFARDKGAVYWDMNILTRVKERVSFPTCCYFYNSEEALVTHRADVINAYSLDELKNLEDERKFIPEWRIHCFEGKWSGKNSWLSREHPEWMGKKHEPSKIWVKIANFVELNPPLKINELEKWDGSKLRGVRGAYIQC